MPAFVTAPAGFLLAVLWFDLMFDVQVLGHGRRSGELPDAVLASIAAYYARVTTRARPMNRLIALVMVAVLAAIVLQIVRGDDPGWVAWASLALAVLAIGVAAVHTVPAAVRLGARSDSIAEQSRLARSILRDHVLCFAAIGTLLALQLAFAAQGRLVLGCAGGTRPIQGGLWTWQQAIYSMACRTAAA